MKKIRIVVFVFMLLFITKNVYADNLNVFLNCPNEIVLGKQITCSINAKVETVIINKINLKFKYNNMDYVSFIPNDNLSLEYNTSSSVSLLNSSKITKNISLGSLNLKANGEIGKNANIEIYDITANSDNNNDLLIAQSVSSDILVNEVKTNDTNKNLYTISKSNDAFIDNLIVTDHPFNFDKEYFTYNIDVDSDVSNIDIISTYDNSNVSVVGDGLKELNYGINTFFIVATNKNGTKNTYTLSVNRKITNVVTNNYDDIKRAIELYDDVIVNANIDDENIYATKEILESIKGTSKKITYNIIKSNKLIYNFIFDGVNIKKIDSDINLQLNFNKKNEENVKKYFGNNNFYLLNFHQITNFPEGTIFKFDVSKIFDKDKLFLFYFNDNSKKLELKKNNLKIINNYVSFELSSCGDYVISDINILDKSSNVLALVIAIVLIFLELFGIIFLIKKNIDKKKSESMIFKEK